MSLFLIATMSNRIEQRPVDKYYEQYDKAPETLGYRSIQFICVPLLFFGLLGAVWALPFPYLSFLGRCNGYINWASFLIAVLIYYYMKLSPILSYIILFLLFACSYGVIRLEKWQKADGPPMVIISLLIVTVAGIALLAVFYSNKRDLHLRNGLSLIIKSPVWAMGTLLKKLRINF